MKDTDYRIITWQLGREPHEGTAVAVRCAFGRPAVVESPPQLADDRPNPTLYYLTCPVLVAMVSRAEERGGVRRLREAVKLDAELELRLEALTRLYQRRRSALGRDPRPEAGIGGPPGPRVASCLHAYVAALLAVEAGHLTGPEMSPEAARSVREVVTGPLVVSLPGSGVKGPGQVGWCADDRCADALESSPGRVGAAPLGHVAAAPLGHVAAASVRRVAAGPVRRAAIDVGTISVRLLVADLSATGLSPVLRCTEVTRLGEQLRPGGRLHPSARQRTGDAVCRLAQQAWDRGAEVIWLVGTSAVREASDGPPFLADLARETGAQSAVLSGEQEAALAYAGVSVDVQGGPLVLDIGGGSTELITASPEDPSRVETVSLALGASRATERWIRSDPPLAEEIASVYNEVKELLTPLRTRFQGAPGPLVGVAGTVTTLACLEAGLEKYDGDAIHLRALGLDAVKEWVARLSRLRVDDIAALPCVQAGRAPVLLAGAVILQAVLETLGRERLVVSERDLLDGLALRGLPG